MGDPQPQELSKCPQFRGPQLMVRPGPSWIPSYLTRADSAHGALGVGENADWPKLNMALSFPLQ